VDILAGGEASSFIKRLASGLAVRWDKNYSNVLGWVRARLGFTLLRATLLCLRGSRTHWRSLGFEDGAAIYGSECTTQLANQNLQTTTATSTTTATALC